MTLLISWGTEPQMLNMSAFTYDDLNLCLYEYSNSPRILGVCVCVFTGILCNNSYQGAESALSVCPALFPLKFIIFYTYLQII